MIHLKDDALETCLFNNKMTWFELNFTLEKQKEEPTLK